MDGSDHARAHVVTGGLGDEFADTLPCRTTQLAEQDAAMKEERSQELRHGEGAETVTHLLDDFFPEKGSEHCPSLGCIHRGFANPATDRVGTRGEDRLPLQHRGNLLDTLLDPEFVRQALLKVKVRVHQDIVLNPSTLLPGQEVFILPADPLSGEPVQHGRQRRARSASVPNLPGC